MVYKPVNLTATASTYHAAGRVQLSVRHAFEVLLAAAVVFGAVADGPEGCQQVLHRLKVSGHHGFFPGMKEKNVKKKKKDKKIQTPLHVLFFFPQSK